MRRSVRTPLAMRHDSVEPGGGASDDDAVGLAALGLAQLHQQSTPSTIDGRAKTTNGSLPRQPVAPSQPASSGPMKRPTASALPKKENTPARASGG